MYRSLTQADIREARLKVASALVRTGGSVEGMTFTPLSADTKDGREIQGLRVFEVSRLKPEHRDQARVLRAQTKGFEAYLLAAATRNLLLDEVLAPYGFYSERKTAPFDKP